MKQHTKGKKEEKVSVVLIMRNTCNFFLRIFEPSYQCFNAGSQERFYQSSQFRK